MITPELSNIVIFSMLTALSAVILSLVKNVLGLCFFNVDTVAHPIYAAALSAILNKDGICSGKPLMPRQGVPNDGWHFLPKYCVLVHKTSTGGGWRDAPTTTYQIVSFLLNSGNKNLPLNRDSFYLLLIDEDIVVNS